MYPGITRPTPELLIGLTASLLLHGSLMHFKTMVQPANIQLAKGRTAVELNLLPSIASAPAKPAALPEPEPQIPIPKPPPPAKTEESIIPVQQAVPQETLSPRTEPDPIEPAQHEVATSKEQPGHIELDKGALIEAGPTTHCTPVYPSVSRRRGEEGTVVLSVSISASGQATYIQIEQSSGHARLDNAAIKAVKSARFTPARRFGKPVDSTLTMPFQFELTQ